MVRISAIRRLQNQARRTRHEVSVDATELWERLLPAGDANLDELKRHYQDRFRGALGQAVADLEDRQRLLLRQHFVEGVASDKLAVLFRVHRATVSRWIVQAQRDLLSSTRNHLQADLGISGTELESVLRLIQSHFDTGIGELLAK